MRPLFEGTRTVPFHFPEVLEDSLGRREKREMWRVGGQWRGEGREGRGGERRDGGKEEHVIVWMQQEEVQEVEYQPGT